MDRRKFLKTTALATAGLAASGFVSRAKSSFPSPHIRNPKIANKVIVLGFDGMDPKLVRRMVAAGELPNFKKVIETGYFGELGTTMPPQSPVAWSSFITGTNPGGHGIYDFIHRDPKAFIPYLSTSRAYNSDRNIKVGNWKIPLESGHVDLMRKGPAFWTTLEEHDIPSSMFALPANFPVVEDGSVKQVSGMGTPDLLGGYGVYSIVTESEIPGSEKFSGGRVFKVSLVDHQCKVKFQGPRNPFRDGKVDSEVELTIRRDPTEQVIKVDVQDQSLILKKGEWSDWVPLRYELMPMFASVAGMIRILVKSVHPELKLYISPINVDPMEPSIPICSPSGYSKELSEAVGRFYTQGLPSDTKALSEGSLSNDEFLQQSKIVLDETLRVFDYEFNRFHEGCFLHYFSSTDQNTHMLWRCMDPNHPLYEPNASPEVKDGVFYFYRKMDAVLGQALTKVDNYTTLMVLSDHGFGPFTREFHLSTWLMENGYTTLSQPDKQEQIDFYQYVDWGKTKAYALGINGIYLNLRGRESRGSVSAGEIDTLKREIAQKLMQVVDPENGQRVIKNVYDSRQIYSGPYVDLAPDLLVGYDRGYRISDEAILGKFPKGIIGNRTNKWSADHCIDPSVVPGIFLSNKRCISPSPGIWDMAPSILNAFGLPAAAGMTGKVVLEA